MKLCQEEMNAVLNTLRSDATPSQKLEILAYMGVEIEDILELAMQEDEKV